MSNRFKCLKTNDNDDKYAPPGRNNRFQQKRPQVNSRWQRSKSPEKKKIHFLYHEEMIVDLVRIIVEIIKDLIKEDLVNTDIIGVEEVQVYLIM